MSAAILDHRRNPIVFQVRVGPPGPVLVANIAIVTSTTPMKNCSELVMPAAYNLALPTTSQPNQTVKARPEAIPREMTSVSQIRIWNLLIDVVA